MFKNFFHSLKVAIGAGPARVRVEGIPSGSDRPKGYGPLPKMIWVTFQKEGIHAYPNAPDEVDFLKHPHRHIFHFKVWIEVFHNDREMEFIILKRWCEQQYREQTLTLDNKSCEMMADNLWKKISGNWPEREIWIEVSEDGENGVLAQYPLKAHDAG